MTGGLEILENPLFESAPYVQSLAVCLLSHQILGQQFPCSQIDHQPSVRRIRIKSCTEHHNVAFIPFPTTALEVARFVDVQTRQAVKYPGIDCECTALSFGLGDVIHEHY